MRSIIAAMLVVVFTGSVHLLRAQELTVAVTDAVTKAPVDAALVRLMRGEAVLASALTDGNGEATFDVSVSTGLPDAPAAFQVSAPYPNPTAGNVRFEVVSGAADAPFEVTVFNVLGQQVRHAAWSLAPGLHAIDADLQGLPTGIYLVRLRQGTHQQVQAVVRVGTSAAAASALPLRPPSRLEAPEADASKADASKADASKAAVAWEGSLAQPLIVSVRKDGYAEHRLTRTVSTTTTLALGLEPVQEQTQATFGPSGGDIQLPGGIRLVVPPEGIESGTADVELSALHANPWFDAPHQQTIHVNVAHGQVDALSLYVPVHSEEEATRTGVTLLSDADSVYTEYLTGSYDANAGALVVPLVGAGGKVLQGQVNGVYLIEGAVEVSLTYTTRLLEAPYYEQDGDNCWAAAWLMLLKSYAPSLQRDAIYELLQFTGVDKNSGLSWRDMRGLVQPTQDMTGQQVVEVRWTNFDNFLGYVMQNVDAGRPVLANLITHQVLFVGYEIQNPGLNQTVTLIAHDPQNFGAQSAFMRQPPSYFRSKYFDLAWYQFRSLNQFVTLVAEPPLPSHAGLTIHLPDGNITKGLSFQGTSYDGNIPYSAWEAAVWDHTQPKGLRVGTLPDSLRTIQLRDVPVWNTSGGSEDVTLTSIISVKREETSAVLHVESSTLSVGSHQRATYHTTFDWTGIDPKDLTPSDSLFTWKTEMSSGSGQWVGGFEVDFYLPPVSIYENRLERSWSTWIPYPSQTATANLIVSGVKGMRMGQELTSGGVWQALLYVPRPEGQLSSYAVELALTEMTGPITSMGWEIIDAAGSHEFIHEAQVEATHTILVGDDIARVYIYVTTDQSGRENVAAFAFIPE